MALDGEGQVGDHRGEAGIGKSRLVQRFRRADRATPHTWVEHGAGASSRTRPSIRSPSCCGNSSGTRAIVELETIERAMDGRPGAGRAIPLLAPLLNLPLPPEYPPSTLSPEQQRRQLFAALVALVQRSAASSRW